ncbi:MAG: glycosyltransferase, partial [Candidatus Bathyarchaeia archaeon]
IIFLLEDDLYLAPNFIEEILRIFEEFPDVGCVYGNCIWVFREGLRSRGGLLSLVSRLVSKLSVHESLFPKLTKRISSDVFDVPVFTMSVACRRDVLIKAGLYDMRVSEPILGEDYDLALRIRATGYRIIKNSRALAYHFTKQVSKGVLRYRRDPKMLRGVYESEVYFIAKNLKTVGLGYVVSHTIYRTLESVAWSIRSGNPLAILYGVSGSLLGFFRGLTQKS